MNEKIKLLAIGTMVSVFVALTSVLMTAYIGNFATAKDISGIENKININKNESEKGIELLKKDVEYIKKGIDDIKILLRR